MKRRELMQLLGGALLPAAGAIAQTTTQPASPSIANGKTIRVIVPLTPGTPSDAVTRMWAPLMSKILGQPVVVENKPGANGILAVQEVMRSAPDGTTLFMSSVSALALNVALVKNLPYDPRKDFTPIAGIYSGNHAWFVKSSFPAKTFGEFVAHVKQNPGRVSAGHSSALQQIQFAAFNKMVGADLLLVPYKATNTSITDVIGGSLDVTLLDMGGAMAQAKGGMIRVLGVSTLKRNPLMPEWPAVSETLPGFDFSSWSALVGPAGMPADVVQRLSNAMGQVLKNKEFLDQLRQAALVGMPMGPDELKAYIDSEIGKWVRVAREARIEPE